MVVIKCCKDCDERWVKVVGDDITECHSTCERYMVEKAAVVAERKALQKEESDVYYRKRRYHHR